MVKKLEGEIIAEIERGLYLLDEELKNQSDNVENVYKVKVSEILEKIYKSQQQNDIGILGSILFLLSRVEINNKNYIYPVNLYGEKIYLDTYGVEYQLDVSFFYRFLDDIKSKAFSISKEYIGQSICLPEVEKEIHKYLCYFNMYVVNTLRNIFKDKDIQKLIEKLETTDSFEVLQNEIYEKPYSIYKKN